MDRSLIALALMIAGVTLFFYTMNLWFWGSIVVLIASIRVAYVTVASGEKEECLKQMEARIKKLEAEKEG